MKIRIKRKDTGVIKKFNNKNELFEFVKKILQIEFIAIMMMKN